MGVTPRSRVAPPRPEAAQAVGDALISQEHEAGLIDMDPPQEHETIAAMARAVEVAHGELREAVARCCRTLARQVDAERALEAERREAAKVRQHLADAINSMSSARDMTGDPNVARYLAIAIEQVEFPLPLPLPLAEVMR